jgi:thiamine pyrophosphate-dependent acetolactate synthase large subunit-like protein
VVESLHGSKINFIVTRHEQAAKVHGGDHGR